MSKRELSEMREKITALIDDIKYQSDNLTDLERLPVIQLKVLLAKIGSLTEQTAVLTHYLEKRGRLSQINQAEIEDPPTVDESIEAEESPSTENVVEEVENTTEEIIEAPIAKEELRETNIEDKLKKMVVTDLNSAIGINEKYLYSSELFGGSTEALSEAIKTINNLNSLSEVELHIAELALKYTWDIEGNTVKAFIELVQRKFDQP